MKSAIQDAVMSDLSSESSGIERFSEAKIGATNLNLSAFLCARAFLHIISIVCVLCFAFTHTNAKADQAPPPAWGLWAYAGSQYPSPTALETCQRAVPSVTSVRPVGPAQVWCIAPNYSDGYAGFASHAYTCPAGASISNDGLSCVCSSGQIYFSDVGKCVAVTEVAAANAPPNDSKDNGVPCTKCGNPINPGSANKVQTENDAIADSAMGGLSLIRTYNGSPFNADTSVSRSFGARWTQPFDMALTKESNRKLPTCFTRSDNQMMYCEARAVSTAPAAVSAIRPDGKVYRFSQSGTSWVNDANVDDRVTATYDINGTTILGWTYVAGKRDETERYNADGKLLSITTRTGAIQRLTYSDGATNDTSIGRVPANAPVCSHIHPGAILPAGRLLCVTDNWGRQLRFEYDVKARIVKAIDPAGQEYLYAYDGPSGGCPTPVTNNRACSASNLTQVTYPDGKSKTYYYNEAAQINNGATCPNVVAIGSGFGNLVNQLTGIVDENNVRFASWTYDCQGRGTSSQHAGGANKVSLAYGAADATGAITTTVTHYVGNPTNPQTTVRSYKFATILGTTKNTSIDQPCVECGDTASRTYDANGNIASRTDFNGNQTTYTYDLNRNLETSRVEVAGTAQARTITTEWHPTYRLPTRIAEPKRLTTYGYDTAGNLLTKTVQATSDTNGAQGFGATVVGTPRTWSYTYNAVGQVLTATGPRTDVADVTTYAYDTQGNLATITNAANQATTLSNYDANGRVGRIVDPNGLITDLAYSPRGWLTSKVVGGEATGYEYDGVGQLKKVTLPDGSLINYTYDGAHRLTAIADSLGNRIEYTLDAMGNRINEEVRDPTGMLTRQTMRVYDALNRVQQITGGRSN